MNNNKLSKSVAIIIPVRDGAYFIDAFIGMLSRLKLSDTDEIIFVDDHSSDSTLAKLNDAAAKFRCSSPADNSRPLLRVVSNDGKGVAAARLRGAVLAQADYLLFADIDDEIPAEGLDALRAVADTSAPDLIVGHHIEQFLDGNSSLREYFPKGNSGADLMEFIANRRIGYLWGKLIKRRLYLHLPLIDQRLTFCEDLSQMLQLAATSKRVAHCHNVTYHYIQHDGSVCNTPLRVDDYARRFGLLADNLRQLILLDCFTSRQLCSLRALLLYYGGLYLAVSGKWKPEFEPLHEVFTRLLAHDAELIGIGGYTPRRRRIVHLTSALPLIVSAAYRKRLQRMRLIK